MSGPGRASNRERIARGIAWNAIYQVVEVALAFGAMLVLVRIIPPEEYGRWSAVLGILTVLNALGFAGFAGQALQVPDGQEPDWSLHCSAGLYLQIGLTLICLAVAAACGLAPAYRAVAPLLGIAAVGLLLDWPAQLRAVMLRRELDFRRLKLLLAAATIAKLGVTLALGVAGGGAYALVLGGNVVTALPLAADLLASGWRPRRGWWRWPDWVAYRRALDFGLQQAGSALLAGARGGLEAAVLPHALGYGGMGLLDRARALFAGTIGRVAHVLLETAYPLLARGAGDPRVFAARATLFVQVLLLGLAPAALYVGLEGPELSRLLYGSRWTAADPLIWPAALGTLGLAMSGVGSAVLLAGGRLRLCLALDVAAALVAAPMLVVAGAGGGLVAYAWGIAAGQLLAGGTALAFASPLLAAGWVRATVVPPLAAGLLGVAVVSALGAIEPRLPLAARVGLHAATYGVVVAIALRGLFPRQLASVLRRVPGGGRLSGWLGLPAAPAASGSPRPGW